MRQNEYKQKLLDLAEEVYRLQEAVLSLWQESKEKPKCNEDDLKVQALQAEVDRLIQFVNNNKNVIAGLMRRLKLMDEKLQACEKTQKQENKK